MADEGASKNRAARGRMRRRYLPLAYGALAGHIMGFGVGSFRIFVEQRYGGDSLEKRLTEGAIVRSKQCREFFATKKDQVRLLEWKERVENSMQEKIGQVADEIRRRIRPTDWLVNTLVNMSYSAARNALGRGFQDYDFRLPFLAQYTVRQHMTYRNTPARTVPQDMTQMRWLQGDCKDFSTHTASVMLGMGFRVQYVAGSDHAFLLVRVFENPSQCDMQRLEAAFRYFVRLFRAETGLEKPIGKKLEDGYYIVSDPTNRDIPGVIGEKYVRELDSADRIALRPEDFDSVLRCWVPKKKAGP